MSFSVNRQISYVTKRTNHVIHSLVCIKIFFRLLAMFLQIRLLSTIILKKSSLPVSRVLFITPFGSNASVIDLDLPSPTNSVSSLPSDIKRATFMRRFIWPYNPRDVLTLRIPPEAVSPYLTFSSLQAWNLRLFSVTLLCFRKQLPVKKRGALCCPDFPPVSSKRATDRYAAKRQRYRIKNKEQRIRNKMHLLSGNFCEMSSSGTDLTEYATIFYASTWI